MSELQELTQRVEILELNLNVVWSIYSASLVFLMQLGFALLESGSVREKNAQTIIFKNLVDLTIGTFSWYLVGYTLANGGSDDAGFAGDGEFFVGRGLLDNRLYQDWILGWTFASTAATIISGAIAERTRSSGYAITSFIVSGITYPVVAFWTWSGGWLADEGYHDLAGSGGVHLVGGSLALVACKVIKPRLKWNPDDRSTDYQNEFQSYNVGYIAFGTLILWFGWFGFNCGSVGLYTDGTSSLNDSIKIGRVAMNTAISGASGGATAVIVFMTTKKKNELQKLSVPAFCNGILAGLVSVTASCDNIEHYSAFIIGTIGGILYFYTAKLMIKLRLDDPLEAIAIHGAGGFWGVLAVGLFDRDSGAIVSRFDEKGRYFGYQLAGALSIFLWSTICGLVIYPIVHKYKWLRVSEEEEKKGSDRSVFGSGITSSYREPAIDDNLAKHIQRRAIRNAI